MPTAVFVNCQLTKPCFAMKISWLLVCVFMLLAVQLTAQQATYTVIKVTGKVYSDLLKRNVKTGDEIKATDKLSFDSKDSALRVMNPKEGQKVLRNVPDNSPRELMQLLSKFMMVGGGRKGPSSRGNGEFKIMDQLVGDTLLILGNGEISVDTTEMSLKKPAGIVVNYQLNGARVEKVLSSGDRISLGKDNVFSSMLQSNAPKVNMYYCQDTSDTFFSAVAILASFVPVYADEQVLLVEVRAIVASLGPKPAIATVVSEVTTFLDATYATPIEANLNQWLRDNKVIN